MKLRTPYDEDYDPELYGTDCSEGIGADQSQALECDINYIMRRVGLGGEIVPRPDYLSAMYEDLSGVPGDYLAALNLVEAAEDHFSRMPAGVREKFQNDPYELLNFLADDKNREEAIRIGLIEKKPVAAEVVAGVVGSPAGSVAPAVVVGSNASGGSAVGQQPS